MSTDAMFHWKKQNIMNNEDNMATAELKKTSIMFPENDNLVDTQGNQFQIGSCKYFKETSWEYEIKYE